MWKLVALLLTVYASHILCVREVPEEIREAALALNAECVKQTGVDVALLEQARAGNHPDDPVLKCYVNCTYDELGTIRDDGTVDEEALLVLFGPVLDPIYRGVVTICGTQPGVDLCDSMYNTHKCYFAHDPVNYFIA